MNYNYILLAPNDLDLFKQLLRVFGEAFEDLPTYQNAVPSDQYLKGLLDKDTFIVIVALLDNQVVGGLTAYVLEKFEQERKEIYIYDLAVAAEHRRKGIASQMIKELKKVGQQLGAYVIFVQADPGDEPAIKLYESLGIKEAVFHFDIEIR